VGRNAIQHLTASKEYFDVLPLLLFFKLDDGKSGGTKLMVN
jgi:hypothetical protein